MSIIVIGIEDEVFTGTQLPVLRTAWTWRLQCVRGGVL